MRVFQQNTQASGTRLGCPDFGTYRALSKTVNIQDLVSAIGQDQTFYQTALTNLENSLWEILSRQALSTLPGRQTG